MTQDEKKDYIRRVYALALNAGICHTMKDFAALLGINRSGLSSAINGNEKALTDSLVSKVRSWAIINGLEGEKPREPEKPTRPDIVIPAATMDLYTSMAKSIDRLTLLVERLQPGASAPSYIPGQKNFRPAEH